jgi:TPR repeat protein
MPPPARPAFSFPDSDIINKTPIDRLRTAAEAGNSAAEFELGRQYQPPIGHLPPNPAEALKWIRRSAEHGNAAAQRALAGLDPEHAKDWLKKAEVQDRADAAAYLSTLKFIDIAGTPEDPAQRIEFWTKCAERQHDRQALFNLGLACYQGAGVPKDDVQANRWLTVAVAFFDWKSSLEARTRLRQLLTAEQVDEGKRWAHEWISKHPVRPDAN